MFVNSSDIKTYLQRGSLLHKAARSIESPQFRLKMNPIEDGQARMISLPFEAFRFACYRLVVG